MEIVTLTFCITISEDLEEGKFTGSPEGVINEAVNMKKIKSRKMMSVIEDMLKLAFTLCFDFKSIYFFGSCSKSIKSITFDSIVWMTFPTLDTR